MRFAHKHSFVIKIVYLSLDVSSFFLSLLCTCGCLCVFEWARVYLHVHVDMCVFTFSCIFIFYMSEREKSVYTRSTRAIQVVADEQSYSTPPPYPCGCPSIIEEIDDYDDNSKTITSWRQLGLPSVSAGHVLSLRCMAQAVLWWTRAEIEFHRTSSKCLFLLLICLIRDGVAPIIRSYCHFLPLHFPLPTGCVRISVSSALRK